MNREYNSKMNSESSSRDFVTGAVIGGLAGALAALLLAPKSGREMRSCLNDQTTTILGKTDKLRQAAMAKSGELASVAKDKASTLTQQSANLLNKVKGGNSEGNEGPAGDLDNVTTSMAETNSMGQTHTATGEEIQKKLAETQKAFDETENKLNQ
ncbi:YtxH domain-containing protein [Mesobacillus zeae]|uniref:YtxH domain-containing protein n=1 Tax=Mesobacillus zeae TaxID=1917180 RepID=A0A398AZV7_9BACI|nr:YtxH domain-containing protein [Mesobacillus zeae]RID83105.1 YtxH domain-containing protein [Mesobacillus zeae]